jgi:DnaJ-class molecular chaperone
METENYYNILKVSENATQQEIKTAYRKLSLTYHPDKNNGDDKEIKRINEAYETLGDEEKRRNYDNERTNHDHNYGINEMEVEELFANIFGNGMMGMGMGMGMEMGMGHGMMGNRMGFPFVVRTGNMNGGVFFSMLNENDSMPMPMPMRNFMEKPEPILKTLEITMETVLNGGCRPLEIGKWYLEKGTGLKKLKNEIITIDIFKGIEHNEVILLKNMGHEVNEFCKGDINVVVHVIPHPEIRRDGVDLIYDKTITLKESLCGFSFNMKYINHKTYTINNSAGNVITPEYKKIIPNMGLTRDNCVGNLIIQFKILFPESLSAKKIEEISKILD